MTPEELKSLAKWMVGIGGVAAGGRLLANSMMADDDVPAWKKDDDIYQDAVDVPVDMNQAEYDAYQAKMSNDGGSIFGPTAKLVGGLASGGIGWYLADKFLKNRRQAKLDNEIETLKAELAQLSSPQIPDDDSQLKAAWEMLDEAADKAVKTAGWNSLMNSIGDGVGSAAKGVFDATGSGMGSLLQGPVKNFVLPAMGTIGALSLYANYLKSREKSQRSADIGSLRRSIRRQEAGDAPYFRLRPRLVKGPEAPKKDEEEEDSFSMGGEYGEAKHGFDLDVAHRWAEKHALAGAAIGGVGRLLGLGARAAGAGAKQLASRPGLSSTLAPGLRQFARNKSVSGMQNAQKWLGNKARRAGHWSQDPKMLLASMGRGAKRTAANAGRHMMDNKMSTAMNAAIFAPMLMNSAGGPDVVGQAGQNYANALNQYIGPVQGAPMTPEQLAKIQSWNRLYQN